MNPARFGLFLVLLLEIPKASALPVNFQRPQEPLQYRELVSKNFYLYHDANTPSEAQGLIRSLEMARTPLLRWFQTERTERQPVIVSATTSRASFANFLTDAIELQTMGQGGRDLAWHELVHASMYPHLNNILGPAGSILHLPWMPAWWIEGLAEALSVSVGAPQQASVERYFALTDRWPSYDMLHSLYGDSEFSATGYGVAGGFVGYLIRTYDPQKLPELLRDFRDYSMPWWWPATVIPFVNLMPMDRVLISWTGKSGEELYNEYKRAAKKYWQSALSQREVELIGRMARAPKVPPAYELSARDGELYEIIRNDQGLFERGLGDPNKLIALPDSGIHFQRFVGPEGRVYLTSQTNDQLQDEVSFHFTKNSGSMGRTILKRKSRIHKLAMQGTRLFWLESAEDRSRLCYIELNASQKVQCLFGVREPESLYPVGTEPGVIWLGHKSETLRGDRYEIVRVDLKTLAVERMPAGINGVPHALLDWQGKKLLLVSGHHGFQVRALDTAGHCTEAWSVPLTARAMVGYANKPTILVDTPDGTKLVALDELSARSCHALSPYRSPLTFAMIFPKATLGQAVDFAAPWRDDDAPENADLLALIEEAPLTKDVKEIKVDQTPGFAPWRGRGLFVFPWIGADGQGNSFGIRAVPLMDNMQNETLYLSALYGIESRFPDVGLTWESTRFQTKYALSGFNRQTFNGVFGRDLLYYRETGADVNFTRYFPITGVSVNYGLAGAHFKPVIGPPQFKVAGNEYKLTGSVAKVWAFRSFSFSQSFGAHVVPPGINKVWEYNQLMTSSSVTIPFSPLWGRPNSLSLGLSGSRTRGEKHKYLTEVYRPLKTFVPGDGGGVNGSNYSLLGQGYLTAARFGDNQVRSNASYTIPLLPHLDTLVGIFYLERLDFTTFINYGTAWSGPIRNADLILAHGYNVDLSTDIKGVRVNLGLGLGQVEGHPFEVYFKVGFDTLIDIE